MENKPTYFSLFSGAGGLDIGFKEAGFKSLGASDIMDESEKTFKRNWPNEPFIKKDIRELEINEILKATGGEKPDVVIGGPPCQGFSIMGDKNSSDPRNTLFEHYVRIVEALSPTCFVLENVRGIKSMFGGVYFKKIANSFASIGYDIYFKVINALDYGAPQKRERVIIVGTRKKAPFIYPKKNNQGIGNLIARSNVGEAIMDLIGKENKFPNHIPLSHKDIVIARYKLIPEGGKLPPPEKLPKEIRRKNFGNTYLRIHRKKQAPTMVPGNNAFPIHPTLNRSLTPREAARLQSFPDNVIFEGNRRKQCILVGNAVPPLVGANLALAIKDHLSDNQDENEKKDLLLERYNSLEINEKNKKSNGKEINFIDLFSGAGGIMIGFQNVELNPILCSDINKEVAKTHKHNFPNIPFVKGDLSNKKVKKEIMEKIRGKEIHLIVGGPPCQGFSIFGKRRFVNTRAHDPHKDPRNKLVYTFIDYIRMINPEWFLMENVSGFVNLDGGSFLKKLIEEFKEMGYKNLDCRIVNTADYGVPQKRKRFIIIGNRIGHFVPWPKPKFFENPKPWQKKYRTVGEVITDLSNKKSQKKTFNHNPMNHSKILKDRMSYIEEGKKMDVEKLPKNLRIGTHTKKPIKNFSHVYKRLHRKEPSITMVPGHSAFPIHPWLNRQLTVREAARIQTFPDEIEFLGSQMEQCRQVGNAFPVMAAEVLGNLIRKAIKNEWKEETISNLAKYSLVDTEKDKNKFIEVCLQ